MKKADQKITPEMQARAIAQLQKAQQVAKEIEQKSKVSLGTIFTPFTV